MLRRRPRALWDATQSRLARDAADYEAHVHRLALKYDLSVDRAECRFWAYVVRSPLHWREVGDPGPRVMLGTGDET